MEDRGRGANAPKQPIKKRITSSRERQQYLSRIMVAGVEDEDRLMLGIAMLGLLSMFLSHFPL